VSKAKRAHWDERASAGANARRELPRLAAEYFIEVRKALAANPSPAGLHRVRLATKHFRYTLELFRPCYGPGLESRLAALRVVQQLLGDVNDAVSAAKLLPKRMRARKFIERRGQDKAAEFRKNWAEVFDAAGQQRRFTAFLKRGPRKR
jgi:CHAD domain-containing protein